MGRVKHALEELDAMGGWRALIVLPPEAADAEALIDALPWVENGTARFGSLVRLFKVNNGLVLLTGGVLTDEEGARLFDMHEQLKGVATSAFVVPPASAPRSFIARMYDTGAAPRLPVTENLPDPRIWSNLRTTFFVFWLAIFVAKLTLPIVFAVPPGAQDARPPLGLQILSFLSFWTAVGCWSVSWSKTRALERILEDPARMTAMRWALTLPPFPLQR